MHKKKREGIVYSTNPDFIFEDVNEEISQPPHLQHLTIWLESKGRRGKIVTLVKGFAGSNRDLEILARELKSYCGTGGSAKAGEIIIQGDFRQKIVKYLKEKDYDAKPAGS
jgi:translation initiation factor 1